MSELKQESFEVDSRKLVVILLSWFIGPVSLLILHATGGSMLDGLFGVYRNNDFQIFLNNLAWFGTPIGFVVAIVTSGLIIFRDKQSKPGLLYLIGTIVFMPLLVIFGINLV